MKKLITILLVFTAFLMSSSSFAQVTEHQFNYIIGSARNPAYNGDYEPAGTTPTNGYLRWKHKTNNYYIIWGLFSWDSAKVALVTANGDYLGGAVSSNDSWAYDATAEPLPSNNYLYYDGADKPDPITVTQGAPTPVELKSFSASVDGKNVNLAWQTATEVNNYGFEVERLTVNGKWEKLGFVAGKGNTNSAQNYKFADNNVSGKVSYRLKQIDIDGKFEYSEVVAVEVIANEFALEQNFPNPFNPSTVINYSLAKEAFVKLAVYNAIGQEVVTLVNGVQSVGAHKVTFNASSFNSGVYFYRIETADFTAMRKMLLVK